MVTVELINNFQDESSDFRPLSHMPRRVTQITKNGLNAQQRRLHNCNIPQQFGGS